MEFGKKTKTYANDQNQEKHGLLGRFKDAWKKAEDDQFFYNSKNKIFEALSYASDAKTAIVDIHISKQVLTYEIVFDLFYTKTDGRVMANKAFSTIHMTKEGYIPSYIIEEVEKLGRADVRFDTDDIETLFKERSVLVKEEISYKELVEECKNARITNIILKDRVFYTRIECYQNGTLVDAVHSALIKEMPLEVSKTLYPCKVAQAVIM